MGLDGASSCLCSTGRNGACFLQASHPGPVNTVLERQPPKDRENRGGAVRVVWGLSINFPSQSSSEIVCNVVWGTGYHLLDVNKGV